MFEQKMAEKNLILKILVGSHLYGTNTKDSDKDFLGVFIPDKDYVLGIKRCEQVEIRTNPPGSGRRNISTDTDTVLYTLPKFLHLLSQNNPNIVETLFAPKKNILYCNEYGQRILDNAKLFVSKKVKHTFLGYAFSQRKKLMFKNPIGGRKPSVDKFGFDVKFASHLIRLLTEGLELIVEGQLSLPLSNNNYLRDIKVGKVKLGQIFVAADHYEKLVEQAYVSSKLPNTPDLEEINKLQISMLDKFWKKECS